jgi:hypothetical protein
MLCLSLIEVEIEVEEGCVPEQWFGLVGMVAACDLDVRMRRTTFVADAMTE